MSILEFLTDNAKVITNWGNGAWIAITAFTSIVMFNLYRQTQNLVVKQFALGVFLVAISAMLHRMYWFAAILLADEGQAYNQAMLDHRWILTFVIVAKIYGYCLHIRHQFGSKSAWQWVGVPFAISMAAGLLGVYLTS